MNGSGEEQWSRVFGMDLELRASGIAASGIGLLILAGDIIARLDLAGSEILWQKFYDFGAVFPGDPALYRLAPGPDSCIAFGVIPNPTYADGVYVHVDSEGNTLSSGLIGHPGRHTFLHGACARPDGGLYFCGRTTDAVTTWSGASITYSAPATALTPVAQPTTDAAIPSVDYTGVLTEQAPGTGTIDTGGGNADALTCRRYSFTGS